MKSNYTKKEATYLNELVVSSSKDNIINNKIKNTLVINFVAGPGSGKSTLAARLFSELKLNNINCELVTEHAKKLVYKEQLNCNTNQIYLFAKQHDLIFSLINKVDIVVADGNLLVTPIYDGENRETLKKLVLEEYNKCNNLNVYVTRKKKFNPLGRIHNLEQSILLDNKIKKFMVDNSLPFIEVESSDKGVERIIKEISKYGYR